MIIVIVIINNNPSTIWLGFLTPMQCVTGREKICLPPRPPSARGDLSKHINQGLRVQEDRCSRSPAAPPAAPQGDSRKWGLPSSKRPPAPFILAPRSEHISMASRSPEGFGPAQPLSRASLWPEEPAWAPELHSGPHGYSRTNCVKPGASHFTLQAFLFSFLQNGADNIFGGCYKEFW